MAGARYPKKRGKRPKRVAETAPKRPTRAPESVETTVFRSGNSDAVRLPRHFGLLGKRVRVRKAPYGRVIIEPVEKRKWPPGFFESFSKVDDDFEPPPRPGPDARDEERIARLFDDPVED
jgi:virulence-associated protein VagC